MTISKIPTLLCDFYKIGHKPLYPKNTTHIYSTFIPRSNKYFPIADKVVVFGVQALNKKYLINFFNEHFFNRPKEEVVNEYVRVIKYTLGEENPDATHIAELHDLGYLPIKIKALPEGTLAPIKVPVLTIENTHPNFFWLTNYLETLISTEIWQPMTSATIAYQYRKLLDEFAIKTTGSTYGVEFSGHDFSMRGMSSVESAQTSGAGHLLSFVGTDTIPAITYHEAYYNANVEEELVGTSIVATEHSIMSSHTPSNSDRDEYEAYKYLITEARPKGFMSIVSDTYDFWRVVGDVLPRLKNDIMNRDGRIVIRPDSGVPELIICGDPNGETELERKGLIEVLYDIFGGTVNELGYKVLDPHIGAIYGDSITLEHAKEILDGLEAKGFASTNIVLGIGSFTYQYNTRDTLGFAMKATYAIIDGEEVFLLKDPKTDDGTKKSMTGRVAVVKSRYGELLAVDHIDAETLVSSDIESNDMLQTVFEDGVLYNETSLSEIRKKITG